MPRLNKGETQHLVLDALYAAMLATAVAWLVALARVLHKTRSVFSLGLALRVTPADISDVR